MIALVVSMLRARPAQAATVLLLSMLATAAAVAGPVALRTVDLAVIEAQLSQASRAERTITMTGPDNPTDRVAAAAFDSISALLRLPGFDLIRAGQVEIYAPERSGIEPDGGKQTSWLVYRDDLCDHLDITAGRCLTGTMEVVIGESTARRANLAVGDTAVIVASRRDPSTGVLSFDGRPATLTVVGVYRPRDRGELYWGDQPYFSETGDGVMAEPVFGTVQTFDALEHTAGFNTSDAIAPPEAFSVDRIDRLTSEIRSATDTDAGLPARFVVSTQIPTLVERIAHGRELAARLVPVAFIPLAAICLFVIFLVVSAAVRSRSQEIGLVTLRGTQATRRWWLATAESMVMILAGAPVGYLLGYVAVAVVARTTLGSAAGTGIDLSALPYAAAAVAGALLVALLGQRRAIAAPVVELLRGVPVRTSAWQSFAVEAAVVVVAGLGLIQLIASPEPVGVLLLVPGLVIAALCLVAARLAVPVSAAIARSALRAGRLGSGLAAIQLARRPGTQRLFALLAASLGLLTFVLSATDVATKGRDQRAGVITGAPTVLAAARTSVSTLLLATRRADPAGAWAMAVAPVDLVQGEDAAPVLAVDSQRLAAVADWRPEFGLPVDEAAAALAPPPARPLVVRSATFTVDIERWIQTPLRDDLSPLRMVLELESLRDGVRTQTVLPIYEGRRTYESTVALCADGCRLISIGASEKDNDPFEFTLYSMKDASGDVIPADAMGDDQRWSNSPGSHLRLSDGELNVLTELDPFGTVGVAVGVIDGLSRLPSIATSDDRRVVLTNTAAPVLVATVATVTTLPRVGGAGALVDLEALDRVGSLTTLRSPGEVWLGPAAPPDAMQRLREAGLRVQPVMSIARERERLDESGPAMALQFHLAAAALGVLMALGGLGLVAAADRRRQVDDLRALRVQGLPRRYVRRAALWGHLALVLAAAVSGLLAGLAAWYVSGPKLPLFVDQLTQLPPPRWPEASTVLVPWAIAAGVMAVFAFVAAWALRAAVRRRAGR
jgi:hypothetical protein